jgi:hypothetical protein
VTEIRKNAVFDLNGMTFQNGVLAYTPVEFLPDGAVVHHVRDIRDLLEPALCQRAKGETRGPGGCSGDAFAAAAAAVTCRSCLGWLHA